MLSAGRLVWIVVFITGNEAGTEAYDQDYTSHLPLAIVVIPKLK
jgi:hypothetical protein